MANLLKFLAFLLQISFVKTLLTDAELLIFLLLNLSPNFWLLPLTLVLGTPISTPPVPLSLVYCHPFKPWPLSLRAVLRKIVLGELRLTGHAMQPPTSEVCGSKGERDYS